MMRRRAIGGLTRALRFAEGGGADAINDLGDINISDVSADPNYRTDYPLFNTNGELIGHTQDVGEYMDSYTQMMNQYKQTHPYFNYNGKQYDNWTPHFGGVGVGHDPKSIGGFGEFLRDNITQPLGAVDRTINPVRRFVPAVDQYFSAKEADPVPSAIKTGIAAAGLVGGLSALQGAGSQISNAAELGGQSTTGGLGGLSAYSGLPEVVVSGTPISTGLAGGLSGLGSAGSLASTEGGGLTQGSGESDIPNVTVYGDSTNVGANGALGALSSAVEPQLGDLAMQAQPEGPGTLSKITKYAENPKNWGTLVKGGGALAGLLGAGAAAGSGQSGPPSGFGQGTDVLPQLSGGSRTTHFNDPDSYYTYGSRPEESFFQTSATPAAQDPKRAYGGMPSSGYNTGHLVRGPGTGRSDDIPARLSDGEYVMDAETVALLGDGSTDEGARKLDRMRANLRKQKGRELSKGKFSSAAKHPEQYLEDK